MFKSENFTRIVCDTCKAETIVMPGMAFNGLNCKCNTEISIPFTKIEEYTNGDKKVELLGTFSNGDVEIKYTDGTLSYRLGEASFKKQFKKVRKSRKARNDQDTKTL